MLDANHPIPYWSQPHQPADRVLMTLKTRGPQSVATIARVLSLTAEAVRLQVARLHEEGLVESETQSAGRGRHIDIRPASQAGSTR